MLMAEGDDFESARRCLLKLTHSYVQTHAGYAIALSVGLAALFSNYQSFYELNLTSLFLIVLLVVIGALLYMIKRIVYWTLYANIVMGIIQEETEKQFGYWYIEDCKTQIYNERAPHPVNWRHNRPYVYKIIAATQQSIKYDRDGARPLIFFGGLSFTDFAVIYSLFAVAAFGFLNYSDFISSLSFWAMTLAAFFLVPLSFGLILLADIWNGRKKELLRLQNEKTTPN